MMRNNETTYKLVVLHTLTDKPINYMCMTIASQHKK